MSEIRSALSLKVARMDWELMRSKDWPMTEMRMLSITTPVKTEQEMKRIQAKIG